MNQEEVSLPANEQKVDFLQSEDESTSPFGDCETILNSKPVTNNEEDKQLSNKKNLFGSKTSRGLVKTSTTSVVEIEDSFLRKCESCVKRGRRWGKLSNLAKAHLQGLVNLES